MGFENFGTVSFTNETKAVDFVEYLQQGKVMKTKCKNCGTIYFPPRVDCQKCLSSDMEWIDITNNSKLVTYTIVHYGPSGFEDQAPYTLAITEFEDGLRIFGRLSKDIKESDIKPGMELKIVPVKLPEDKVSYEFQQP
jgi:uncharacterized OB-fold protein